MGVFKNNTPLKRMVSTEDDIQMDSVGDRLKQERERLGLSQRALGEHGGVQANAQGKYEKGDRSPDAAYLAGIAVAGADVLYIITGRKEPGSEGMLAEDEGLLLEQFRAISMEDQRLILGVSGLAHLKVMKK